MELLSYCRSLPKVELHAHLGGSLSDATVMNLLSAKAQRDADFSLASAAATIRKGEERTVEECFKAFEIAHSLTDSVEAVYTITLDVIQEFAADNVRYLELRTTPKNIPNKVTKKEYMNAVFEATIEAMKRNNITVRLMLSIDRARGVEDASSTLQLAKEYLTHDVFGPLVCGLDVSGNPHIGDLKEYLPILQEAQRCGLKLAVHLAEVPNDTESLAVLSGGLVDRIGHGTFLHPATGGSEELHSIVREHNLPLELCISSNIKVGTVETAMDHHFGVWRKENHPVVICTDDKGVFCTSLSDELFLCAQTFSLSEDDLHHLCLSGVDAAFLPEKEKQKLKQEVLEGLNSLKGKLAHK